GGFDRDSPYAAKVNVALLPDELKGKPVLTPGAPNGSPIGFRVRIQVKDKSGNVTNPSETTTYPVFDPASVFHQPVINGYQGLNTAGRAYAVIRAEDGDGTVDRRIDQRPGDAVGVADRVDAGGTDPLDVALRSKVLTFFVNHAPVLLQSNSQFKPRPNTTIPRVVTNTVFNLLATDDDPFDPSRFNPVGGKPNPNFPPILRWKIAIVGKIFGTTRDTCWIAGTDFSS